MCPQREKQILRSLFIVVSQLCQMRSVSLCLPVFVWGAVCFIFSCLHSSLIFHFHLFHYFPVSGLHLNSTDYTLFLNDHSWGLRIQKPFGWLGPLGLPYITNHIHRRGRSTCKAYTYLDEHKSHENELKGCFLCAHVCLCFRVCAYVTLHTFHALIPTLFSQYE